MHEALLVLTTCADRRQAQALAGALVEQRLAACVNAVQNVVSTYCWQGAVQADNEVLLLIKTTEDRYPALERAIETLHAYELPELIAVRIDRGSPAYLSWLAASTEPEE
jgi:periplasmic divalent cation tolerance protein